MTHGICWTGDQNLYLARLDFEENSQILLFGGPLFLFCMFDCPVKNLRITFKQGDVYRIREYFDEPFDITLCLGGLYHIADPAFVLRQARELTTDRLIVQTARVLPLPGNWARFVSGSWHCSPGSIRNVLLYAGFRILEEQQPRWRERRRFPWYAAMCELCEPFALLMRE